jgi:hypothetical protein
MQHNATHQKAELLSFRPGLIVDGGIPRNLRKYRNSAAMLDDSQHKSALNDN